MMAAFMNCPNRTQGIDLLIIGHGFSSNRLVRYPLSPLSADNPQPYSPTPKSADLGPKPGVKVRRALAGCVNLIPLFSCFLLQFIIIN